MTAAEKKRMILLVRAVESLFAETCALKTVLAAHRISRNVWKVEMDRLINDPEMGRELHQEFQHVYDDIEQRPDDSKTLEDLLELLPQPKKQWN
jgi:hypothetical protein